MNVRRKKITDLLDDALKYFDTHDHDGRVHRKEFERAVKNYLANISCHQIKTVEDYLSVNLKVLKDAGIELLPEYDLIFERFMDDFIQKAGVEKVRDEVLGDIYIFEEMGDDDMDQRIIEDTSLFPIEDLDVSPKIITILKNNGIKTLKDLLKLDYKKIEKIPQIGLDSIIEIKKYVHSLGLTLKNETVSEEEGIRKRVEECRSKGIKLIQEELDIDNKLVLILNRNGIITLEDLINFGEDVYNLNRMGSVKAKKLKTALAKKKIILVKKEKKRKIPMLHDDRLLASRRPKKEEQPVEQPVEEPVPEVEEEPLAFMPSEDIVEELKKGNDLIMQRIAEKEKYSAELDRLIEENQELHSIEQNLDKEIAEKLEILKSMKEGSSYGGK